MREGGVDAFLLSLFVSEEYYPGRFETRQTLRLLETARQQIAAHPAEIELALSAADIARINRRGRIAAVLAKAEPPHGPAIRGARHIMRDDSDINATRHARALVGGVLAGVVGDTRLFVSGGAEHQGPDGGGPVAVIARV